MSLVLQICCLKNVLRYYCSLPLQVASKVFCFITACNHNLILMLISVCLLRRQLTWSDFMPDLPLSVHSELSCISRHPPLLRTCAYSVNTGLLGIFLVMLWKGVRFLKLNIVSKCTFFVSNFVIIRHFVSKSWILFFLTVLSGVKKKFFLIIYCIQNVGIFSNVTRGEI